MIAITKSLTKDKIDKYILELIIVQYNYRGYYMAAQRYRISLRVLKNIS